MKKWFENLKISRKLLIGFLFITLMGIIIGVVGIINIANMARSQQQTYDQCILGIEYSSKAEVSYFNLKEAIKNLYIYYDVNKDQYCQEISKQQSAVDAQIENYSKTISDENDQANFNAMKTSYESYKKIIANKILDSAKSKKPASEVLTLIRNGSAIDQNTSAAFETTTAYNDKLADESLASNKKLELLAFIIMIALIGISLVISLILSFYISSSISDPMKKFAAFAEMIAVGDIEVKKVVEEKDRLWALRKDEVGELASAFEKMISTTTEQAQKTRAIADGDLTTEITVRSEYDVLGKALSELVDKFHTLAVSIVSSADQVDIGAKQVADSGTSLSQGAAEQASAVEELTASLEEVTAQTTQNAQNAKTTDNLAMEIKKNAETSNSQMTDMLHAMDEISKSSENISKIIKVIEDIAFQTNILALNAAIEAARAGEHGKGFSVVAEEVRNLAAKSAEAAKETTNLIENSINKVETGTKIANETAGALDKIMEGITKASELIDSISTASNEQAAALEQINSGIMNVSNVVQNNAAASEESASASEELSSQADSLKANVSVFKLSVEKNLPSEKA